MKIVEDTLKGILLISLIAVGVLFFYQKSVLKDAGFERGEVVEVEEKNDFKNGIEPNHQKEPRGANVEYTSFYDPEGIVIEEPDLEALEKETPTVNGFINLRGSFADTYILGSYSADVRVAYIETIPRIINRHSLPVSDNGEFNETISLEHGSGEYKITIYVPQIEYSHDDIGAPEVVSFYVNNGIEGWQTYRNEEYGFEIQYPGDWILLDRYSIDSRFAFGPDILTPGYDGRHFVHIYDKQSTSVESLIADMGDQFEDRKEVVEKINIKGVEATKATITTPSHPDWVAILVIVETNEKIITISNGAVPSETFEDFYRSFKFTE